MSDPTEDLACIIERLREDLQGIFATESPTYIMGDQDGILRTLCKNISELRDEIIELTGAIYEVMHRDR